MLKKAQGVVPAWDAVGIQRLHPGSAHRGQGSRNLGISVCVSPCRMLGRKPWRTCTSASCQKKKNPKNQSPTSPHGIREYTHEKSPLSPTLCLFPPAAGGKVGGRSYVRRHGTSFCLFPPQNSDKSRQTHAQLSQLLTRSAREGHGAELPRRPGAELQRDVANKQQRFAAVCSGEVSTQRWHDPGHQRQHSLCVLFIAKYEHPWQGCVRSTCDTVGLKSLRDPNAPESWPQGGSSQLPKQKNGKWL